MTTIPFHQLIETTRQRAGLSHDHLADRAWTSPGYTHRICTGRAKPRRDTVIRLGVAMNLGVAEIDELLRAAGHLGLVETNPSSTANAPELSEEKLGRRST
jgi:predicted transcriptional regulator